MNNFWYKFLRPILSPIYKFYYNPKIEGKQNIPEEGPIIIAGNHKHIMDQCNIIISTKRVITYMAKKEYFDNPLTKVFFKMVKCIPVDRSKKDENAKSKALDVLTSGGVIGIFPEGTRNKTKEKLLAFKYGTVSMAKKTNSLIVPFGISGDYKFRSKNLKIKIGKPIDVSKLTIEEANQKLYDEISNLIV